MLVIQVVEIFWTKATRGAPRSKERVGLPRAFPVSPTSEPCLIQRYRIEEREAFAPRLVKQETAVNFPGSVDVLQITALAGGRFALGISGTPYSGQPRRYPIPKAITLQPGQSARIIINARHTTYSGQFYSETIYHIACGDDVASEVFLQAPEHELDLKAALF